MTELPPGERERVAALRDAHTATNPAAATTSDTLTVLTELDTTQHALETAQNSLRALAAVHARVRAQATAAAHALHTATGTGNAGECPCNGCELINDLNHQEPR